MTSDPVPSAGAAPEPVAPDGYDPDSYDPDSYDAAAYPAFAVTVDLTLFTVRAGRLCALLIRRGAQPYAGAWALPGGFVGAAEDLAAAAERELAEETGVARFGGHLEQLATYGRPGRDPRMRVVSVAYLAFAPDLPDPQAGSDAADARWWAIEELLAGATGPQLAFDHPAILAAGLERVRAKLEYTTLAARFLAEPFTLGELHAVYAAVWGSPPHLANFRRKVLSTPGFVAPADGLSASGSVGGRPAALYRRGPGVVLSAPLRRGRPAR